MYSLNIVARFRLTSDAGALNSPDAKFHIFTAMKTRVEIFWLLTKCNVAVGYRRFGGPCYFYFYLRGGVRWRQQELPKRRYPTATLHCVTTQKTSPYNVKRSVSSALLSSIPRTACIKRSLCVVVAYK